MTRIAMCFAVLLTFAWSAGHANAQTTLSGNLYGYQFCSGQYALCESSICTPTGGTIDVNVAGGGTASFPAAVCKCPIKNGISIADVQGGNMQGDCKPPGKGKIWSLYFPKVKLPQEVNDWSEKPAARAVDLQLCSSNLGLGDQFANCFSFACTVDPKRTNGDLHLPARREPRWQRGAREYGLHDSRGTVQLRGLRAASGRCGLCARERAGQPVPDQYVDAGLMSARA